MLYVSISVNNRYMEAEIYISNRPGRTPSEHLNMDVVEEMKNRRRSS